MQMPPEDVIPPHWELHEGENGLPVAVFVAKPPGADQFALAFALHEMRQFLGQAHKVLLEMRVILAHYFLATSCTTGETEHLISAATMDADAAKGRTRAPVALCGARPKARDQWEIEPLDPGALPCAECTCPTCLHHYEVQSAPKGKPH